MPVKQVDREVFLDNLRRSGLLAPDQWSALARALPADQLGGDVARELVRRGFLTAFQAEMLLSGRTNGFQLGQYRILSPLGRGGMGRVFQAVHVAMNRVVALKLVSQRFVKTAVGRKMFEREVRAAARLMHTNIVTAYDANKIGKRLFLIMEYVDGPNLDELVRERGPLDVPLACELIRQAAHGLQYAFEMGMVHRDIKPANLLVGRAGGHAGVSQCIVKILDFGLARFHAGESKDASRVDSILARENAILGTPDFVSPEQARDLHQVDIRSDIYSLGCTFYYLLTGQVPFPGGSNLEKLARHGTTEPTAVEAIRSAIPAGVGAIVRGMMARDPSARFQTPSAVAEALEHHAVNGPPFWDIKALHHAAESSPSQAPPSHGEGAPPVDGASQRTLSHGDSATPFSVTGLSSLFVGGLDWPKQRRRLKRVLYFVLLVEAGLLGWVAWLLFHP